MFLHDNFDVILCKFHLFHESVKVLEQNGLLSIVAFISEILDEVHIILYLVAD